MTTQERARRKRRRSTIAFAVLFAAWVTTIICWPSLGWLADFVIIPPAIWVSLEYAYATGWLVCHTEVQGRVADVIARAGEPTREALERAVAERDQEEAR